MKTFKNKVAAITGAGSGIGQQLAIALAKQGCHLSLSDVNSDGLALTLEQVQPFSVKVTTTTVDVSDLQQVRDWAAATQRDHGSINMIFNNAGVALGSTIEGGSYDDLNWIMNINFWGVVYGTKEFLPFIKLTGDGHIINISSLFGLISQPTQSGYNATKFAVRGFTESLRQELDLEKNGVSATCVHPGGIKTNIAKAARTDSSLARLGLDPEKAGQTFDKLLTTAPEEAAQTILNAVRANKPRVLIGADAKFLDGLQRVLPTGYQTLSRLGTKMLHKFQ